MPAHQSSEVKRTLRTILSADDIHVKESELADVYDSLDQAVEHQEKLAEEHGAAKALVKNLQSKAYTLSREISARSAEREVECEWRRGEDGLMRLFRKDIGTPVIGVEARPPSATERQMPLPLEPDPAPSAPPKVKVIPPQLPAPKTPSTRARILDVLKQFGRPMSFEDIQTALDLNGNTLRKLLGALQEKGDVERCTDGTYRLSESQISAAE